jgi:osmotically-inducible protein OsmY
MSSSNRNQRDRYQRGNYNYRGDYDLNDRNQYRNEDYRDRGQYNRSHHSEESSRFHGPENEDHLRHEPSNQWGNYGNYRSSHRNADFGSGYFGNAGSYFGNSEGGHRDNVNRSENDWYNSPDNNYYNQSSYYRKSAYNRNNPSDYELSNRERWNNSQNFSNDNYSMYDNNWNSNQNGQGLYRGKGPRGYNRSDDRIKEDINDRLSDNAYIDATDIEISVSNGEVILSGTVEDRTAKRRAEDVAEAVSGVRNVENRLRIQNTVEKMSNDSGKSSDSSSGKSSNGSRSRSNFVES